MGCGFGRILKEIAVALGKKGKVTGIEIDDFALEESVKVAEIIKMDALNMGFRDGSFDGVLLLWGTCQENCVSFVRNLELNICLNS